MTPAGVITEIIDASGDGAGKLLDAPFGIASDDAGDVYVAGAGSDNAFEVALSCGSFSGLAHGNVVVGNHIVGSGGTAIDVESDSNSASGSRIFDLFDHLPPLSNKYINNRFGTSFP